MGKGSNSRRITSDNTNRYPFQDPRPITEIRREYLKRLLEEGVVPDPIQNEPYHAVDPESDRRVFTFHRPSRIIRKTISAVSLNQVRRKIQRKNQIQPSKQYDILKPRDWISNRRETMICLRRRVRRAILFAFKKTGSGQGKRRPARYTENSTIRCRR